MAKSWPLFLLIQIVDKSVDGVLGIRTRVAGWKAQKKQI